MNDKKSPLELYCEQMTYKKAVQIDEKMAIVIKPKPKWLPTWLYRKIIKESVEIVTVQ